MEQVMERCCWCPALFPARQRKAHYRTHLSEVEQMRKEVHGEVERPGPVDRFLADLMA
jgi:hypothetical protein